MAIGGGPQGGATLNINVNTNAATAAAQLNVAAAAVNHLAGATSNATPQLRLASHQIANLQAQANDMFVSLYSGQNIMRVFIQQGAQIAATFKPGTGVGAALRSFGTEMKNFLLNPLTLATIGFGAAATAGVFFFEKLVSTSKAAEEALKRHHELLRDIRQDYDDITRAQKQAEFTQVRKNIQFDLGRELTRLRSPTGLGGGFAPEYSQNLGSLAPIISQFRQGQFGVSEFERQLRNASANVTREHPELRVAARELIEKIADAVKAEIELYGPFRGNAIRPRSEFANQMSFAGAKGISPFPMPNVNFEPAFRDINLLSENIKKLVLLQEKLTGASEVFFHSQLLLSNDIKDRLRPGGNRFPPQTSTTYFHQGDDLLPPNISDLLKQSYPGGEGGGATNFDQLVAQMDELRDTAKDFISTLIDGLRQGQSFAQTMSNVFSRMADRFFKQGTDRLVDALLGKTGTADPGALGGLFAGMFGGGAVASGSGVQAPGAQVPAAASFVNQVAKAVVQSPTATGPMPTASPFTTGMGNFIGNVGGQYNAGPTLASLIFGGLFGAGPAGGGGGGWSLGAGGHGGTGIGMGTGWVFHNGGIVGAESPVSRRVNPMLFVHAPRLHSGLGPDEFPAILERGERVISRRNAARGIGGGVVVTGPTINVEGSVDQKTLDKMAIMLKENNAQQQRELTRTFGGAHQKYTLLKG